MLADIEQVIAYGSFDDLINVNLFNADRIDSFQNVDSVFDELGHSHAIAVEDALDLALLTLAVRVKLCVAHSTDLVFGNSGQAIGKIIVCYHKLHEDGVVVEQRRGHYDSVFCHNF